MDIRTALLNNKNKIKYSTFEDNGDKFLILGIGMKAIKYRKNNEPEEFAFHDKFEGRRIGRMILTSFDNEVWNDEVREKINSQKKFCEENKLPFFVDSDGFCFSCHHHIWDRISLEQASSELITGCPHCSRSYCD